MKSRIRLTPAFGLAIAISACILLLPASALAQANYTWTGGGGNTNVEWSDGTNWGGSAPSGTVGTISFPASACTSTTCQSDDNVSGLTASTLSIVTPTGAPPNQPPGGWQLSDTNDYPLTLTSGLSDSLESQGDVSYFPTGIYVPIKLGGPNTWTIDGDSPFFAGDLSAESTTDSLALNLSNHSEIGLGGASNEVGPVTITGSHGSGNVSIGNGAHSSGDLNGTDHQSVTLDGGSLSGNGTTGDLITTSNAGSQILPGFFGSTPTGSLQTYGATLDSSDLVTFDIPSSNGNPTAGTDYPQLTAPGQTIALANSELLIDTIANGTCVSSPPTGTTYTLVSAGTVSGRFGNASANGDTVSGSCGITYTINYTSTTVTATVTSGATPPTQTTTSLSASPQSPVSNQSVTLTANVSANSGPPTPTGTVAFLNDGTDIAGCSAVQMSEAGQATCQTSFAASSSPESLTAIYNPSSGSNFAGSTSNTETMTVGKASATTTVSASSTSPSENQSVTYTATVSPQYSGAAAPSGSVGFSDNGSPISGCSSQSLSASGTATCTTSYASPGSHSITASYGGDGNFSGSSSPGQTVAVQSTPPPATRFEKVKVSGTVAKVTVSCTGASGSSCTDNLKLTIVETIKHGAVTAVAAAKKTVVVGRLTVTLAAGQTKTVALSLNATGKRLLAKWHTLKTKLKITQSGATVANRTIKFKKKAH